MRLRTSCLLWPETSTNLKGTRSIQRTQTPPRLWNLTLWCDLNLFKVKKADVYRYRLLHCTLIGTRYDVYGFNIRYHHLFILCDLWPSPVTVSFCQAHLHLYVYMYFMLLSVCTKNKVCMFSKIRNMDICI